MAHSTHTPHTMMRPGWPDESGTPSTHHDSPREIIDVSIIQWHHDAAGVRVSKSQTMPGLTTPIRHEGCCGKDGLVADSPHTPQEAMWQR